MSKIKIQANTVGTGVTTLTSTATSTDRTLTLPDANDTLALQSTTDTLTTRVDSVGGQKNVLINGGFDIWQRGGVFPDVFDGDGTNYVYTADRWYIHQPNGAARVFQGSTTDPTVVDQFRNHTLVHDVTTGGTSGQIGQRIENVRTLSGKKATLSMWVNGVTNAKTFDVVIHRNFGTGGSGGLDTPKQSVTADFGTWKKVTLTFDVPSIQGKTIGADSFLQLTIYSGETAGRVDFGNIQLEEGEVATDFEVLPVGLVLSLCQRYYERIAQIGSELYWSAFTISDTTGGITLPYTTKYYPPDIIAPVNWTQRGGSIAPTLAKFDTFHSGKTQARITFTELLSGSADKNFAIRLDSGFIEIDAEIY